MATPSPTDTDRRWLPPTSTGKCFFVMPLKHACLIVIAAVAVVPSGLAELVVKVQGTSPY